MGTTEQLAFAAIADARATLHDAIVGAGMTVLHALLEEERSVRDTSTARA